MMSNIPESDDEEELTVYSSNPTPDPLDSDDHPHHFEGPPVMRYVRT